MTDVELGFVVVTIVETFVEVVAEVGSVVVVVVEIIGTVVQGSTVTGGGNVAPEFESNPFLRLFKRDSSEVSCFNVGLRVNVNTYEHENVITQM